MGRARILACTVILALAGIFAGVVSPSPATALVSAVGDPVTAEQQFVDLINGERAATGLRLLTVDGQLTTVARNHSATMASEGTIFHNQQLAQVVTGAWKMLGENVGMGGSVTSLHNAFMASLHHKENILGNYDRVALGVVISGSTIYVTEVFWLSKTVTTVSAAGTTTAGPVGPTFVGVAAKPAGGGWTARSDGAVTGFAGAAVLGSANGTPLARPVVGIAATPTSAGYWLVASDGGIFSFGDARFLGSTGGLRLNRPVVGMAPTPTGKGYWLVASDGGIFSFGDARFLGSTGAIRLNQPIVGMASTAGAGGYWLVASDGGIFTFGDATFFGSAGGSSLAKPVVGMARTPTGKGYWFVCSDGRILARGDAAAA